MSEPSAGGGSGGHPETAVLLVDDDEAWVSSTAQILAHQREAFVVETATDIDTARDRIAESDPDCVVCDFQLETATGLDLLTDLRERGDDRPFVLITGQGSETVASEAIGNHVTDYIPKQSLGGRNDLLARRIENSVESYRTRQALARERRSKDAMLDILTSTSSREGLLQQFCAHLVRERGYDGAWLGTTGRSAGVVPRAVAGMDGYVDAVIDPETPPEDGREPALLALSDGEPHVATDVTDGPSTAEWQTIATAAGFGSVAAVPLTHEGATVGVLAVYDSTTTLDPESVVLLEEYGETIGYALRSAGWREALLSPTPVAVEFELRDEDVPLVAVDSGLPAGSRLTVLTMIPRADTVLYILRVEGVTAPEFREAVADLDDVVEVSVTRLGERLRCELAVPLPTPETVLTDHGGRVVDVSVDHDGVSIQAVSQDETEMRTLVDVVTETYAGASVRSTRSAETVTSATEAGPLQSLTAKQRRAIEVAYFNGYFERPREHDTSEVAAKLGVSRQTLTQHLRAGQRKLLSALLDTDSTATEDGPR